MKKTFSMMMYKMMCMRMCMRSFDVSFSDNSQLTD